MIITFCLPQFSKNNLRLQPWLTFYRISLELLTNGNKIHTITDSNCNQDINGIHVHTVKSLRGTNTNEITNIMQEISPDIIIVSVTPLSLATTGWYKILKDIKSFAYLSYSFYSSGEIIKAFPHLTFKEKIEFGRHLLVPKVLWEKRLTNYFDGVICQSAKTGEIIKHKTRARIPVYTIPPGIDKELWFVEKIRAHDKKKKTVLLYTGKTCGIRGFFVVLDALKQISDPNINLRILARGANEKEIRNLITTLSLRNIKDRVTIKGGWLKPEELIIEIQSATAVLLPFVLVPSELPVTIMEVISCGTPAIVTDIDGLPEAVDGAGIVIPQADSYSLADAILKIHQNKELFSNLKKACLDRRKKMLSWKSVAKKWQTILAV
jgi:glycosyltransferase involved in cell wall biosynthesis